MKFKPTGTNILVKLLRPAPESQTVQIPEEFQTPSQCGIVIATGPGTEKDPMLVKPGDNVVLPRFGGTDLTIDGNKHQMISQEEFVKAGLLVETT